MNDLYGINIENLLRTLPEVLAGSKNTYAVAMSIATAIVGVADQVKQAAIYTRIDELPESILDTLAYDFKVDWYDYDFSLEEKRQTLKTSWFVHKKLGTKSAVEKALSAIYPGSKVAEWHEYGGEPYHFRLIIPVDVTALDIKKHSTVLSMVDYYKNLRSFLEDIEYHGASSLSSAYTAAAFLGCEFIDSAIAVNH